MPKPLRLSLAIAAAEALPSAFVVFRGFEDSIRKARALGFDGVELALKHADEIDPGLLSGWLNEEGMEISAISTGQVYAETGFMFTDERPEARKKIKEIFYALIDLAADFGQLVNIGRARGQIGDRSRELAKGLFLDLLQDLCAYADKKGVKLILEPVNRYEIDFINSVEEGVELIHEAGISNLKLMPDVFHMNIEDRGIASELIRHAEHIEYVHLADSNRLAPGQGHTDFQEIFDALQEMNYKGWLSLEILPKPDPETAAQQGAEFLLPFIQSFNQP